MNDPIVKAAWENYVKMSDIGNGSSRSHVKARMEAWHNYVLLRDQWLGLPTHNKYFLESVIYGK